MALLTQISTATLRESYNGNRGHYPTWLGEAFGWSGQQSIYNICEQIAQMVNRLLPDYFPLGTVKSLLIAVLDAAYKVLAHWFYWDWADRGDQIVSAFDAQVKDYTAKIDDARAKLTATIAAADRWLGDHEKRIQELEKKLGFPIKIGDSLNLYGILP
jgi:hypothetical protein